MNRGSKLLGFLVVQLIFVGAFAASYAALSKSSTERLIEVVTGESAFKPVKIDHEKPYVIEPLYNDVDVVTDEELAAVLYQVLPLFKKQNLSPNHVEHALRTWHQDAVFQNPNAMSGEELRDFLVDNGRFMLSWEEKVAPLLDARDTGVYVRWGRERGASVHHDHTLACLTEARVPLSQPVRTPRRPNMKMADMINQAIFDFSLDERETEWSAIAFGLWLPPTKSWVNGKGRRLNFDMVAERLLRGHQRYGVCGGTHRLYSLMALLRLDKEHGPILSEPVRKKVYMHLERVGKRLEETQFEDGHWPSNWPDGKDAVENPADHPAYKDVIATGHHLEWLAIAPKDMHPPRESIIKAAKWIIANTTGKTRKEILSDYTFYSHVGNALALWRQTRPAEFWRRWEIDHPYVPEKELKADDKKSDDKKTDEKQADDKQPEDEKTDAKKPDEKKLDEKKLDSTEDEKKPVSSSKAPR
jgi:hypothetical protein